MASNLLQCSIKVRLGFYAGYVNTKYDLVALHQADLAIKAVGCHFNQHVRPKGP